MSDYEVAWTPSAKRALRRLPEKVAVATVEFIYGSLVEQPWRIGKPLRFQLEGLHSARRGDYRVIYRIEDTRIVITEIDHRADAYRRR
ncbi:type II toxin-antitoxin system RelE family toxin [Georgenia sp. MJ170]|uniref:type II toxin-antitoxin system RelE family toxin n=1 Tax=Georgenia sunbinii TaxID=3117728 RepID=UPI002F264C75